MTNTPTTPPAVVEQWRAEFETEWRSQKSYRDSDKETALKWFLLGRQTACIELPKIVAGSGEGHVGHSLGVQQCYAHVIAQGYQCRVKGE